VEQHCTGHSHLFFLRGTITSANNNLAVHLGISILAMQDGPAAILYLVKFDFRHALANLADYMKNFFHEIVNLA
jgi:hypothetical protein